MTAPSILCKVRALYAFESDDPSSLRFNEGDYINVFYKLPSGWWDGWCNGQRGWFPSNYVEVIEDYCDTDFNSTTLHQDELLQKDCNYYSNNQLQQFPAYYEEGSASTIERSTSANDLTDMRHKRWCMSLPAYSPWQQQEMTQREKLLNRPLSLSIDYNELISYKKLLVDITLAINNLVTATRSSQSYNIYTTQVVNTVRNMMLATGTASKESINIKSDSLLRSHHRHLMSILSRLVFSAQTGDTTRLFIESQDLLSTARNYVHLCESMGIELQHIDPILLSDWSYRRQNSIQSKYQLVPDLIDNVIACGNGMQESMKSFIAHLGCSSNTNSLIVLLFTHYRNIVNQNGQFLSIIEDVDFQYVAHSPRIKELAYSKQRLYTALGTLFIRIQSMTEDGDECITENMRQTAHSIIEAIQTICKVISELLAEQSNVTHIDEGSSSNQVKTNGNNLMLLSDTSSHSSSRSSLIEPASSEQKPHAVDLFHDYSLDSQISLRSSDTLKHFSLEDKGALDITPPNEDDEEPPVYKANEHDNDNNMTSRKVSILTATTQSSRTANVESEPEYLRYDYAPSEIVFTTDGSVKGGTLRALVERMTLHDYLDMNFNTTFLLTYRSFCTSREFLDLLKARYNIQPPDGLTPEEYEVWVNKKQKLVRLRVFNVLKIWLEQYYYEDDSIILDQLLEFTNTTLKNTLSFSAFQLEKLISKRKEACTTSLKKLVMTQSINVPDPILPRNLKKFKLPDIDTTEMARQLTLIDYKLYSSIRPIECLDKAWSKDLQENGVPIAANIQASIHYCNQITTWVSDEILSQSEVKKRSMQIKYWVNVAEKCRQFNNFNTCMAILSAFDNGAIGRLKRTWESVGARTHHIVAHIRKLMGANRNFVQYRALIHSVNPPCIPFLGIYLQDLTFIEDGNPNFLKGSNLINFAKRAKTAEVIREIQQYQSIGYPFKPVEEIQGFIWENLHSSRDEDQLYNESLKLEPK
ncbi:Putative Ras GEF [Rhizopus microsporus]|nr:Putative Ras GEF [Rhizopus microsporus]